MPSSGDPGGSAGGGEIHYLTWVYHALGNNAERYTPVSMVYTMAQLDYPVQNMLDKVWGLWVDDVGAETKLASILSFSDCGMIIGNPWCDPARCANGIFVQFFHRWKPSVDCFTLRRCNSLEPNQWRKYRSVAY